MKASEVGKSFGIIAKKLPFYEERPQQISMMEAVEGAFSEKGTR